MRMESVRPGSPQAAKSLGSYYTPPELARILCRWAVRTPHDDVLDPSCGDGAFLAEAAGLHDFKGRCDGIDLDRQAVIAARRRLQDSAAIHHGNFFDRPAAQEFDAVVGNPPFIRYQRFDDRQRATAFALCRNLGVDLNRECSSWAPFVVISTAWLKPEGRLAMIIPREALFVNYAHSVFAYLKRRFARVRIVALDEPVFPGVLIKVAVLLAEGRGPATEFAITEAPSMGELEVAMKAPGGPENKFGWAWSRVPPAARPVIERAMSSGMFCPLSRVADVRLGLVTGGKDFFTLSPTQVEEWRLPRSVLRPVLGSPGWIEGTDVTARDVRMLQSQDEPCWLLDVREIRSSRTVRSYLRRGVRAGIADRYKCRIRTPWYRLEPGRAPDAFLSYLTSDRPRFAGNSAGLISTNNVHQVFFHAMTLSQQKIFAGAFHHPFTLLSVELLGRTYGGGVLKIEPGDADRIWVPSPVRVSRERVRDAGTIDRLLRAGEESEAIRLAADLSGGFSRREIALMGSAYWALRERRTLRRSSKVS